MKLSFFKFQGTGNDFIMVDNRKFDFPKNDTKLVQKLCHRRFGIGADGLILLENSDVEGEDFRMVYYNSDGNQSSMCGNGGRCIVAFARYLGIIGKETMFTAVDGQHKAIIDNERVSLKMQEVTPGSLNADSLFLDTGSPHHILFTENLKETDVKKEGARIRYSEKYVTNKGTNVNFVQEKDQNTFLVRTYERGVEDETYSCGTGVTAVALAAHATGRTSASNISLETPGGTLEVSFKREGESFKDIWLKGPAEFVFKGEVEC